MIGDRIVTDDYEQYELKLNCWRTLLGLLHKCCGKFFGKKPCKIDEANSIDDDREIVRLILDKYKNHPSFFFVSIKRLHYEFTTYTTLQDYYTIQLYNTTGNDTPRSKRL